MPTPISVPDAPTGLKVSHRIGSSFVWLRVDVTDLYVANCGLEGRPPERDVYALMSPLCDVLKMAQTPTGTTFRARVFSLN